MFADGRTGRIVPSDGGVAIEWPSGPSALEDAIRSELRKAAEELGGRYMEGPLGRITVHPLGGCRMADTPDEGVVNPVGAVFDPSGSTPSGLHEGLYVCDAAVIPTALGANPLLTITALAERTCDHVIASL
jgi:cholesterol oxidase